MTPLLRAGRLLAGARDVVLGRVVGPEPPAWCSARGWEGFLLGLEEGALARCEAQGLARALDALPDAPGSLRELAAEVRALEAGWPDAAPTPVPALPGASPRKGAQVAALVELVGARRSATSHRGAWRRVIDAGAGRGHLTRELARALGVPALGLERDPARVATARALGGTFEVRDAANDSLGLAPGDLLVGLHACGRLSDALVEAAAAARVDLVLVGCCLQKTELPGREPLSALGRELGLSFPRPALGLSNLLDHGPGAGEVTARAMAGRETRLALRLLLGARGIELAPGAELRGLPRWGLRRGLSAAVELALEARGLPAATAAELSAAAERAADDLGRVRRLSLPRAMLGRPLELAVALDRARALEEAGLAAAVVPAFGLAHGPRNLGITGNV